MILATIVIVALSIFIGAVAAFVLASLRPAWPMWRATLVAALPMPVVLLTLSGWFLVQALSIRTEQRGPDNDDIAMIGAVVGACLAAISLLCGAGSAGLVKWIAGRR